MQGKTASDSTHAVSLPFSPILCTLSTRGSVLNTLQVQLWLGTLLRFPLQREAAYIPQRSLQGMDNMGWYEHSSKYVAHVHSPAIFSCILVWCQIVLLLLTKYFDIWGGCIWCKLCLDLIHSYTFLCAKAKNITIGKRNSHIKCGYV